MIQILKIYSRTIGLCCLGLFCLLSDGFSQTTTYTIERKLNVKQAYKFNGEIGIKANASGGKVEVRMYAKQYRTTGGRGDINSLLYGAYSNANSATSYNANSWDITYTNVCNVPVLPKKYVCPNDIPIATSMIKPSSGLNMTKNRIGGIAGKLKSLKLLTPTSEYDVIIELELNGTTTLNDVTSVKLPGVGEISGKFFGSDFSNLWRSDLPTVISHRGYWRNATIAQNSRTGITAAQTSTDVDHIELDIRSTSDKKAICFHDDKPQKILQATKTGTYANSSVYDIPLATLRTFKLYDRFDLETSEYLLSLKDAFEFIKNTGITKPINLDIGIPANVPQGSGSVPGQPFFDAVFLEAIELACQNGLTSQIIFKGKYTWNDPIWTQVQSILGKYYINYAAHPIIAYTPKLGDDITDYTNYRNNWLDDNKGRNIPGVVVVGMEVRLKNDTAPISNFLKESIPLVKAKSYAPNNRLRVGVFSETPTTCQGYWTKSAIEKYIDSAEDYRNNFDWVLNNGYDYIITETPEVYKALILARQ